MLPNQSFELGNKISTSLTSYPEPMPPHEALDKHRGKGQQKVTVEHVHVHRGGQAIVGAVKAGWGWYQIWRKQGHAKPIAYALSRDAERIRDGAEPVPLTAMTNGRCRMHGGTATGAPKGNRNPGSTALFVGISLI